MNFLMLFMLSFIPNPLLVQLEAFKTALMCMICMEALVLCCRLISGHYGVNLDVIGRLNHFKITKVNYGSKPSPFRANYVFKLALNAVWV